MVILDCAARGHPEGTATTIQEGNVDPVPAAQTEPTAAPSESTDISTDSSGDICTSCGIGSFSYVDLNTDPCAYRGYLAYQCSSLFLS